MVLYIDCSGSYMTMFFCETELKYFRRVNFTVCKLYVSKKKKKLEYIQYDKK